MSIFGRYESASSLPELIASVDAVANSFNDFADAVERNIADAIQEQFDAGVGPDGEAWEPLANGGPSHLTDSGDMRGSVVVTHVGGGEVSVTVDDPADYHQRGTYKMPARQILPEDDTMPASWEAAIEAAAEEVLGPMSAAAE
jgi:hypothetical protein